WNLLPSIILAVTIPLIMYLLHPKPKDTIIIDKNLLESGGTTIGDTDAAATKDFTANEKKLFSEKMEHSILLNFIFLIIIFSYLMFHFSTNGFDLDIDIVIILFLFLGMLLHKTPMEYVNAMKTAIKGT